jgi:hypothetical protein
MVKTETSYWWNLSLDISLFYSFMFNKRKFFIFLKFKYFGKCKFIKITINYKKKIFYLLERKIIFINSKFPKKINLK